MQDNIGDSVWRMATVLKQAGVAFTDYVSQLTYLLFLKMEEDMRRFYSKPRLIPEKCAWSDLKQISGPELLKSYEKILATLSSEDNILGVIFHKAQNKITQPVHLSKLIDMLDKQDWLSLDTDIKGQIYESILDKNSSQEKGAGQYFTPRALIRAIVDVMCPRPRKGYKIHDPFCGTGGFLLGAYEYIKKQHADIKQLIELQCDGLTGNDISPLVVSLCSMNMYLHGIVSEIGNIDKSRCPIQCKDTLRSSEERSFDMILANPPFGTAANDISDNVSLLNDGRFFAATSNTQLNALQHIMAVLTPTGRAAVVLPDNVLCGEGDKAAPQIRQRLLEQFNLHTILRLPTGIFYAQGVKANVLFFDRCPLDGKEHHTHKIWVYDYRTNVKHTLKQSPLKRSDLDDFVSCYNAENIMARKETYSQDNPNGRWRCFTYEEIVQRDKYDLDFKWIKEENNGVEGTIPELLEMLKEELEKEKNALVSLEKLLRDIEL